MRHHHDHITGLLGLVALSFAAAASAAAQPNPANANAALTWTTLRGGLSPVPTTSAPYSVMAASRIDPFWGPGGLWARPLSAPATAPTGRAGLATGLATGGRRGAAVWDPSSRSFFAMFAGILVRVDRAERPGRERLHAIFDGIEGHDLDVRAAAGVAVSREPNDTIVLHTFSGKHLSHRVLLRGPGYFEPRLSPDGRQVLVSQSDPSGGRMVLVQLHKRTPHTSIRDLGRGYGPSWHPAGDRIIFSCLVQRGSTVGAAELWMQSLSTGKRVALTATKSIAELEPAISPDGAFVAYRDARTGRLLVSALPRAVVGGGR